MSRMKRREDKEKERIAKLTLATSLLSLISAVIELIIKLIE